MNTVEQYFQKQLSCASALRQAEAEEGTASTFRHISGFEALYK